MTQIAVTAFANIKAMIAAGGGDEAAQNAALDRTHALYQEAIAREQAIADGSRL
jgi:hypothetical protein